MDLREEFFEAYLRGDKWRLTSTISKWEYYETLIERNLVSDSRRYSNPIDYIASFFAKYEHIIMQKSYYIDILIDIITDNGYKLCKEYLLANLSKYSNGSKKMIERRERLNGIFGSFNDLKTVVKFYEMMQDDENRKNRLSHKNHIESFFSFFEENRVVITANLDRLIDIIIELKAVNFIEYIIVNFKKFSDCYVDDKESIGNLITILIKEIVEIKQGYEINHLNSYITKIEEEMGISLLYAHTVLAGAVEKTQSMGQKINFLSQTPNEDLIISINGKIEEVIKEKNVEEALRFAEENLERINRLNNDALNNSVNSLMDFVTATNNPKYIYLLATSNKFGQNRTLLNALIKINIPAFIYLYAATIENISEDDMELIVAYMLTTNDAKLIGYLLWHLRDKNNVSNGLKLALQNKLNVNDKYWFISYDIKTPNKLKGALLSDDIQMLAEFGIVLNEDNLYDDKKQLVLADIQAGL